MTAQHTDGLDAEWIAECTVCTWQLTTAFEYKANDRADVHTAATGHRTEVNIASMYEGQEQPPC